MSYLTGDDGTLDGKPVSHCIFPNGELSNIYSARRLFAISDNSTKGLLRGEIGPEWDFVGVIVDPKFLEFSVFCSKSS